ncbi:MAG: hypothetical protein ABEJ36_00890 [Candidatus Nanosalina sp.]
MSKAQNKQDDQDLQARTAGRVSEKFRQNPQKNSGGEVEDAIQHEESLEGAGREEAGENFGNILEDPEVEAEEKTAVEDGEEVLNGAVLKDSPLVEDPDDEDTFNPEVDTDFSPHQGEVASAVVDNPGDLMFGVDRPRRVRDRNLPEEYASFEYALKLEMMFPDWEGPHDREKMVEGDPDVGKENRMYDPRYFTFELLDGEVFHAMGAPTATQLNSGTPVGDEMTADEFFYEFFNGGEKASVPEIATGLSTLFDADPLFSGDQESGYEIEVESGRDMIYDLFVSESDAVSRKEVHERWGEDLGQALPTNENYGVIEDFTELSEDQAVEDYVDIVMNRPAKLAPEVDSEHIKFGRDQEFEDVDEDNVRSLSHLQALRGEDIEKQWAVFDQERQEMDLETLEEEQQYEGKIMLDSDLVDVTVDHSEMDEEEFDELMDGYFDVQNTMVRPDVAPKTNGTVESRNFSHSDRTYNALLTQKAMIDKFQELQQKFYEAGMTSENAGEMRERFVQEGLDARLPDYNPMRLESGESFYDGDEPSETGEGVYADDEEPDGTLREFYRFEVLPTLEDGVREAFGDETPYVVQKLAENHEYDDFEEEVLSEFDNMEEFLEYQDLAEEVEYDASADYSDESEAFKDWFVETAYRDEMEHWLDPDVPTVNEELLEEANRNGPEAAANLKKRASQSSYRADEAA